MFSNSSVAKEERVTRLSKTEIAFDEINGFVTAMYENECWLGCVLQLNQDDKTVSINILIPHGPSQSYNIQLKRELLWFLLITSLQRLIQEPFMDKFMLFQKRKPRQQYNT